MTLAERLRDALVATCHPRPDVQTSVLSMTWAMAPAMPAPEVLRVDGVVDEDVVITSLFEQHAHQLVRLARLFVDDRNAAEDLVQEAFIRLARNLDRVEQPAKAAAYLRSIVLNLCRDHNRRGLVSLRHHLPADQVQATFEDEVVLREDQREVIDALRSLPVRQRDCVVLRHYFDAGIAEIAATLGISQNSVKTHLQRGMAALARLLGAEG